MYYKDERGGIENIILVLIVILLVSLLGMYIILNSDWLLADSSQITAPETQTPDEPTRESTRESTPKSQITLGKINALSSARHYLSFTAFSYNGLIQQLKFEGYTHAEAVYAADKCGADWYEQAAKCAEHYLSFTSFSRDGLIRQLEFEGFTRQQAEYGVRAVGY